MGLVLTTRDFRRRVGAYESLLQYPADAWTGNTADCDILKFSVADLRLAPAAGAGLQAFYGAVDRVAEAGGCIVAHNVQHDLRQVEASRKAVGYRRVPRPVRVLDSLTCAPRILELTGGPTDGRWLKLGDLARASRVAAPAGGYHQALNDALTLQEILAKWPLHVVAIFTEELWV
jgi:hypothetical protein